VSAQMESLKIHNIVFVLFFLPIREAFGTLHALLLARAW